jgi:hypothetical protein
VALNFKYCITVPQNMSELREDLAGGVRNTCETDPISLYFAYKRKNFFSETGAPYGGPCPLSNVFSRKNFLSITNLKLAHV